MDFCLAQCYKRRMHYFVRGANRSLNPKLFRGRNDRRLGEVRDRSCGLGVLAAALRRDVPMAPGQDRHRSVVVHHSFEAQRKFAGSWRDTGMERETKLVCPKLVSLQF